MVRALPMVCLIALGLSLAAFTGIQPDKTRKVELLHLLKHDCGSCHGMTLKGGLGPALLAENLQGKPDKALAAIILDGVPGTPMPPWRGQLSEDEAFWLVDYLRKGRTQ